MNIIAKIRSRLSRKMALARNNIKHVLGLNRAFYVNARGARILTYHGICNSDHLKYNTIFLTVKTFEAHLQFFKKYCNVISLDDFYAGRFSDDRFNICLTFDDGFANNHKYVLPLIKQYQVPAAFFVTAIRDGGYDVLWNDFLGIVSKHAPRTILNKGNTYVKNKHNKYISKKDGVALADKLRSIGFEEKAEMMQSFYHLFPFRKMVNLDYWLQMTPKQIKELSASPLVTIGAHGYYHNDLAQINPDAAVDEMLRTKQYLERITDKRINSLAFPYGAYTLQVIDQARQMGYAQLLALEFLHPDDGQNPAMRERFTMNPYLSVPNQMRAILTGSYEL